MPATEIRAQQQPLATQTTVATGSPTATATPLQTAVPLEPCEAGWRPVPVPGLGDLRPGFADVAAISPDDVWIVGGSGTTYSEGAVHWDGATWSRVPTAGVRGLRNISAVDHDDVWATNGSDVIHWDGTAWSLEYDTPVKPERGWYYDIAAISADDVWLVGIQWPSSDYRESTYAIHWDGEAWTVAPSPGSGTQGNWMSSVSGIPGGHVWATGVYIVTTLFHWTGTEWTTSSPGKGPGSGNTWHLSDVEVIAPEDVWAVGSYFDNNTPRSATAHYDGSQWSYVPSPDVGVLHAISAVATNDIWAVGEFDTLHWDGSAWSQVPAPPRGRPPGDLTSVDVVGPEDVWAVGADVVLHYSSDPFWDVPKNNPFYSYVRCLACQGLVSGYTDASFRPNERVTRGQVAKIVSNAAGYSDDIPESRQTFEDVPPDSPFWLYIERVYAHGAISGYACGMEGEPCPGAYYRPGAYLTRGQLAKIAANVAGYNETPTGQTFRDVSPGDPFYVFIERAAAHNVISGYACGSTNPGTGEVEPCPGVYFRPGSNITRGQTAKIVVGSLMPGCEIPTRSQPPAK
ncbi:MAG TPA: S-layer homology domain-containing protein [Chloroflexia bacterium]